MMSNLLIFLETKHKKSLGQYFEHDVPWISFIQSKVLARLAAAHRGAVRALQTFVQHLPDCRLELGLPRGYHDLAELLRQLSLCCAQLEVAGETAVPESVLHLMKDFEVRDYM